MFHLFLASVNFTYSSSPGTNVFSLLWYAIGVAGMWRVFEKAGEAGWQAIIPFWNLAVLFKIAGRPMWWAILAIPITWILLLIPLFVFIVMYIVAMNDLSKSFGRGVGTTLGLIFLGPIFYCILGFGDAQYLGPRARGTVQTAGSLV